MTRCHHLWFGRSTATPVTYPGHFVIVCGCAIAFVRWFPGTVSKQDTSPHTHRTDRTPGDTPRCPGPPPHGAPRGCRRPGLGPCPSRHMALLLKTRSSTPGDEPSAMRGPLNTPINPSKTHKFSYCFFPLSKRLGSRRRIYPKLSPSPSREI